MDQATSTEFRAPPIPNAFLWRKAHSFTGVWITLFLIEHLFVNSQAALLIGDQGYGFVHAVNAIRNLPYLQFIELLFLGVPFAIHGWWGIKYLQTSKINSIRSDGTKPSLPEYARNRAYTWQRITSWILLFGIILHVIHMRFVQYPAVEGAGLHKQYMVKLEEDPGLAGLAPKLDFTLYKQNYPIEWAEDIGKHPLKQGEVVAVSKQFGVAELLMVRDTFKSPLMMVLYTIFVLAACYHGFNGLWTAMISWGVTMTHRSQQAFLSFCWGLMMLVAFLGLAAIWGTYWINLK